jgi:PBSX family phage portal protein
MAEEKTEEKAVAPAQPRVIFVNSIMKAEEVLGSKAEPKEDRFRVLEAARHGKGPATIAPQVDPRDLRLLVQRNSILPPLIDAYATNIDGTGWELVTEVESEQNTEADETRIEAVGSFFEEPWPGESFKTQRQQLRVDIEETGNGYLEVMRSATGRVRATRRIDPVDMRMVEYDDAQFVPKRVTRNGVDVDLQVRVRERRFAQILGGKMVYFKEFRASRDLNADDGEWAEPGARLGFGKRATEIIHLKALEDVDTPYGIPRWWSNSPSVIGSRKAEEFNLQFFDSGGVPPILLIVQGGKLAQDAERALRDHFMSTGESRHQAAILEAFAASGDIDSSSNVRVTVERFGAERQQDSMFEKYSANSDERVRRSFRLPPIFLGNAADFNFATAFASYTVAEAQVFQPERELFDEKVNLTLLPELENSEGLKFKSKPLSVRDTSQQIAAMRLVKDIVTPHSMIEAVNETTNQTLVVDQDAVDLQRKALEVKASPPELPTGDGGNNVPDPSANSASNPSRATPSERPDSGAPASVSRAAITKGLNDVAGEAAELIEAGGLSASMTTRFRDIVKEIDAMEPDEQRQFRAALTLKLFPELAHDPIGAQELAACTYALFAQTGEPNASS